jgi:hypothetical protein
LRYKELMKKPKNAIPAKSKSRGGSWCEYKLRLLEILHNLDMVNGDSADNRD